MAFEPDVYLLTKSKAELLRSGKAPLVQPPGPAVGVQPGGELPKPIETKPTSATGSATKTLRITGAIPPELWNRFGTKLIPKLRSGDDLKVGVDFSVTVNAEVARNLEAELRQAIQDLGLESKMRINTLDQESPIQKI